MVEWFQANDVLLSNFGSWITALFTFFIVLITWRANTTIQQIAKYSNLQNDRHIYERIYIAQSKARDLVMKDADFRDNDIFKNLHEARGLSELYGEKELENHINKCFEVIKNGYVISKKTWDSQGQPILSEEYQKNIDQHDELVKEAYRLLGDLSIYINNLRVEK